MSSFGTDDGIGGIIRGGGGVEKRLKSSNSHRYGRHRQTDIISESDISHSMRSFYGEWLNFQEMQLYYFHF